MPNHELLCDALRDMNRRGEMPVSFVFRDVVAVAKRVLAAQSGGLDYASMKVVQMCCSSDDPHFGDFRAWSGDPRQFPAVADVRQHWVFRLEDGDAASAVETNADGEPDQTVPEAAAENENRNVCELVASVFKRIVQAPTCDALGDIVRSSQELQSKAMSESRYPPIRFHICAAEIESLQNSGILDSNGRLRADFNNESMSTLEKLLFAIVWKNGDLGKECHIVKGVQTSHDPEADKTSSKAIVFRHFGKYLADRNNPIIDQHVMRAFALYRQCGNASDDEITRIRSKADLKSGDVDLIRAYHDWLVSDSLQPGLRKIDGYRFHVDKVLFALGKWAKQKK